MISPLRSNYKSNYPEIDFPFYTPFMVGRNQIEAQLELVFGKPQDYAANEITLERRKDFLFLDMKEKGKWVVGEEMLQSFYVLLKEIYEEIKSKKPTIGNTTFYIDHNWEYMLNTGIDATELLVWMRGAWVDAKFLDEPIQSPIVNHIPTSMMKGY